METVSRLVNRPPVPLPAAAAPVASACIKVAHPVRAQCQSLRLSSPDDAAEVEARSVARQVVSMPARQTASRPGTLRSPATLARSQATPPAHAAPAPATPAARLSQPTSGGEALPESLRRDMEPRFGADFSRIRIHRDARAAQASRQLNAAAFTIGHQIYFGQGQWQPDSAAGRELIAHELTHTIQQGAAGQIRRSGPTAVAVNSPPAVQRLGMGDALNYFADAANAIPGYTLLTLIIGRNPINMQVVERNVTNVLRAFIGLIPGGEILFQVLQRYGVVDRIGNWVNTQTAALGLNFQTVRDAFVRFTGSLGFSAIFSPGEVWQRALTIFMPIIGRITGFVGGLVTQAVIWLKETFMEPLSGFCRQIPGYGLVTVMLGRDPFTNAPVPRTALPVVRAFAEFIPDGTEKVDQLVQSGALERAYTWFQQETGARNLTWARVSGTFTAAWATLQLSDVLHPIDTMQRMVGLFRPLFVDLVSFAGAALMKLLELIYEAAMGAGGRRILDILMRARSTFIVIIRNPVGFLRNLLGAVGQGVRQFMNNILGHLRDGVIAWLTGPVARAGIQVPERWDARGIIWFVLQILGLTWANVRGKLVRLIGEPAMATLEGGFALINDIRERGLVVALRERVTEFFGNLRESALGAIRSFIQERIVMAGITQLLSMLIPVAAIMQAIQKTYTTIQFFIQKINQILDFVESIVNSIAAIASGAIGAAATFVERTMARTIPVILDFLARFIGLGDVGAQVQTTIRNLQGAVDRMLDRAVDWIRNQARNLASRAVDAGRALGLLRYPETSFQAGAETHRIYVQDGTGARRLMMASDPLPMATFLDRVQANPNIPAARKSVMPRARALAAEVEAVITAANAANLSDAQRTALLRPMQAKEEELARLIQTLLRDVPMSDFDERYSLEGMVASYGAMPRQTRDRLTPDHQPQAGVLQAAADLRIGTRLLFAGRRLRTIVRGSHVDGGLAINLHHNRHVAGRTYGRGPNRAALDSAVASHSGNEDAQRDAVVGVLRGELQADVAAMRTVAANKASTTIWADVHALPGATADQKTRVIDGVSQRIVAGQARMAAQNLDDLKGSG